MTDREFDQLLYQGAAQLPPDDSTCRDTAPWRRAFTLICWGLALTTVTLNFLHLQYILPPVGAVLLLLGFRALRRENRWLRLGYGLSALLAAWRFAAAVVLATPLAPRLDGGAGLLGSLTGSFAMWFLYLALWRGLKAVFHKAGQAPRTGAAGGLVAWHGVILALALLEASGWLLVLPILTVWLAMLWGLFKLSRCLDQAGYAIQPAPVRFSNGRVLAVSLSALLAAVLACLLLFSRYPVNAAPAQAETGQAQLRAELLDLGFPEKVLADLTDEEVAGLEGALDVAVKYQPAPSLSGLTEALSYSKDLDLLAMYYVQVQLPEDTVRYFLWFSWEQAPARRFREGIEIVPTCQYDTICLISPAEGRLLWEEDGQPLQAPLAGEYGGRTASSILWGSQSYQSCDMSFSLPNNGEHVRGYVSYAARAARPGLTTNFNAEVCHVHQEFSLSYPWKAPCQYRRESGGNTDLCFPARQFLVLFTLYEPSEPNPPS